VATCQPPLHHAGQSPWSHHCFFLGRLISDQSMILCVMVVSLSCIFYHVIWLLCLSNNCSDLVSRCICNIWILCKFIGLHSFSICFVHLLIAFFLRLFCSVVCFVLFIGPQLSRWWYGSWLRQLTGKISSYCWILLLCCVFNAVGAGACLYSFSFSTVLGFFLFRFCYCSFLCAVQWCNSTY
jgi:hypothetical protein